MTDWALELAENPNTYAPLRPGAERIVTDRYVLWLGRGAYRALVHARWEDAVARGTPLAATDAGSQSRPILERMGFREVCTIRCLIDRLQ
jgi:hypothetical protein